MLGALQKLKENKSANKKIYVKIGEEKSIDVLENENVIMTFSEDEEFTIEGEVSFIKHNYEQVIPKINKTLTKTCIYLINHNLEDKDKVIVIDWHYALFRKLIDILNIQKGDKIKIKYLGYFKKAVKKYPELKEILYNPNPLMKIFDIEKIE